MSFLMLIIESYLNGEYEEVLNQEFTIIESNGCPKCKSIEITSKFPLWIILFVIISLGLAGIIFPIHREIHKCKNCGFKWKC